MLAPAGFSAVVPGQHTGRGAGCHGNARPGGGAGDFGKPPVATISHWFTISPTLRERGEIREGWAMKSFWTGAAIAVIIAVVAGVALNVTGQTSAEKFSTSATRLSG